MALSGSITPAQRFQYAVDAGFTAPNAIVMAAISLLECGNCDMSVYNSTGDSGLWQINKQHGYSLAAMADPVQNARAAFAIWKSQGFNGWCTYPGGCGGASTISWPTFNAKIAQVTASLAAGGTAVPTDPSTDPSGTGSTTTGSGTSNTNTSAGSSAQKDVGINLGAVGPFPVNVPTGLALGVVGVILLLIGALIFSSNFRAQITSTVVDTAAAAA